MNNGLIVSVSPHYHKQGATTQRVMRDVLIALIPALIASVIIFGFGSQPKPPAKSITSLQAVPMGAMTFFGSLMAEPSTVMHFSTSGMPVVQ